jgi:hypothetical protein
LFKAPVGNQKDPLLEPFFSLQSPFKIRGSLIEFFVLLFLILLALLRVRCSNRREVGAYSQLKVTRLIRTLLAQEEIVSKTVKCLDLDPKRII